MRAHPVGIIFAHDPELAFRIGMITGAITHGHPNGHVPAGVFAALVALLLQGKKWGEAIEQSLQLLNQLSRQERQGTIEAIAIAQSAPLTPDPALVIDQQIKCPGSRGGGWQGHDALAIAAYAIRCAPDDPIQSVQIAVNHSGDSDSTGSIAGALMGARYGYEPFRNFLIQTEVELEHYQLLAELGQKLYEKDETWQIVNH